MPENDCTRDHPEIEHSGKNVKCGASVVAPWFRGGATVDPPRREFFRRLPLGGLFTIILGL
eukprot:2689072-Lingulodinium_polyedra.AAC.1